MNSGSFSENGSGNFPLSDRITGSGDNYFADWDCDEEGVFGSASFGESEHLSGSTGSQKKTNPLSSSGGNSSAHSWILRELMADRMAILTTGIAASFLVSAVVVAADLVGDVIYHLATSNFKFALSWDFLLVSMFGSLIFSAIPLLGFTFSGRLADAWDEKKYVVRWSLRGIAIANSIFNMAMGYLVHPFPISVDSKISATCLEFIVSKSVGLLIIGLATLALYLSGFEAKLGTLFLKCHESTKRYFERPTLNFFRSAQQNSSNLGSDEFDAVGSSPSLRESLIRMSNMQQQVNPSN